MEGPPRTAGAPSARPAAEASAEGRAIRKPGVAAPAAPAARAKFKVPESGLQGEQELEVIFPAPMVPEDQAGTTAPVTSVLDIKPPLPGVFRWQSSRSGTFVPARPLPLGPTRRIGLASGLRDSAGQPVTASPVQVAGNEFLASQYSPRYFSPDSQSTRQPEIMVYFNDAVAAAAAARLGSFHSEKGPVIAVTARTPLVSELEKNHAKVGTWTQQNEEAYVPSAAGPAVSVVAFKPVIPLPEGQNWKFLLKPGIPNFAGSTSSTRTLSILYGSIVPLTVVRVDAHPVLDGPRSLHLAFSKKTALLEPAQWAEYVQISPRPEALAWKASGSGLTVEGDFQPQIRYRVEVRPGLPSADGMALTQIHSAEVQFPPHDPLLTLPAFDHAQWIGGKAAFSFTAANLSKVSVRIKKARPETAPLLLNGYATYEYDEAQPNSSSHTRLPWSLVPGTPVWNKEWTTSVNLDQSEKFDFSWDDVGGGKRSPGIYFINVEGTPRSEIQSESILAAQAVVQLSDIGLVWKQTATDATVFAFSHSSGKPLAGVSLRTWTRENEPVGGSIQTSAEGMATLPVKEVRWLLAELNGDLRGVRIDDGSMEMDRWAYDLPMSDGDSTEPDRKLLLFTERPVYQPGETVFFKALSRMQKDTTLSLPDAKAAKLILQDPRGRELSSRDIQFSDTGSFADALRLPQDGVGWYRLRIEFPPAKPKQTTADSGSADETTTEAENTENGEEGENEEAGGESEGEVQKNRVFQKMILVQEYQPNSFRITFDEAALQKEGESLKLPLRAAYLMGKSLGTASLGWTSRIAQKVFRPENFDGYHFGQARSQYVYDGSSYQSLPEDAALNPLLTGQGTLKLSEKGEALMEAKVPATFGYPGPKSVTLETEITDLNQQTIAAGWEHTVHTSDYYLGVRYPWQAVIAGSEIPVSVVAVNPEGKKWAAPVQARVLVEHLTWNSVRVETAGGGTEIRNEMAFARVGEENLTVVPENGREECYTFRPRTAGTHNLTFTSVDASGRTVRTMVSIDVYANREMAWQQEEGVKVELLPDRPEYQPGETARIVVKSPFSGTALVTVEREGVLLSSLRQVEAGGSIDLAVEESWAPNVFVSVLQVRGGLGDPRAHPQPDYRLGYTPLKVASRNHQLQVQLEPAQLEVRPRGTVEVTARVLDSAGNPVPHAELALWAVDEGVLSLMPWQLPDPVSIFHSEQPLSVRTGVSLQRLLPENPDKLEFANKGFVIGGGGDGESAGQLTRKDFKATAYWHGMLRCGLDGTIKVTFPAPDNLTEFRLAAVASEGVARFGAGESKFRVNQPLMLEPALPRFANAGDEITLKAVLHNTTDRSGELAVELSGDDHVSLLDPETRQLLASKQLTRTITIGSGQSRTLSFPVRFISAGPLLLKWKAGCATEPLLADAVESRFVVGFAEPLMRELDFHTLGSHTNGKNLLTELRPELPEGTNRKVTITLSNTRLTEAAEAINQLLHYPYGCAEQTMSSMLPWITLRDMKQAVPALRRPEEEIADAIQKGVNRLLSMQTTNGGLAYWPGGAEPTLWASAHGTLGLVLASRGGAAVPAARLNDLTQWLSDSLRTAGAETQSWVLFERCYAAYALALAGKAEPGYHETLFGQKDQMSRSARALLALAIAESNGPADLARQLLQDSQPNVEDGWWGYGTGQAIRVLAHLQLKDPQAEEELGRMIAARGPRGDWNSTISNAWVLMVLSREAAAAPSAKEGTNVVLSVGGALQEIHLSAGATSESVSLELPADAALPVLSATVPAGRRVYAQMEFTSRAKPGMQPGRSAGFTIERSWHKLAPDGKRTEAGPLRLGDLVQVTLKLDSPRDAQYVVVDDPLPATFEAVNPNFTSMAVSGQNQEVEDWTCDYKEMRRDRVLFFRNEFYGTGKFQVSYLARVVAEGKVTIPATKVEMMYDPSRFGLSPSGTLTTEPAPEEAVAGR